MEKAMEPIDVLKYYKKIKDIQITGSRLRYEGMPSDYIFTLLELTDNVSLRDTIQLSYNKLLYLSELSKELIDAYLWLEKHKIIENKVIYLSDCVNRTFFTNTTNMFNILYFNGRYMNEYYVYNSKFDIFIKINSPAAGDIIEFRNPNTHIYALPIKTQFVPNSIDVI